MKLNRQRVTRAMGALVLVGVFGSGAAEAGASEQCDARLTVETTPDVPDASDEGFLSSRLQLLRVDDDSVVELDLSGPGPKYRCESVIEAMREDGRVVSIRVGSTAALTTVGANQPISSGESSGAGVQVSKLGLGALYWAVQHPRRGWQILLPIRPNDAAARQTLNENDPRDLASPAASSYLTISTAGIRKVQAQ